MSCGAKTISRVKNTTICWWFHKDRNYSIWWLVLKAGFAAVFRVGSEFGIDESIPAAAKANLPVNIHPCHIRLTIALDHAQEFPAVPLIKVGMVSHKVGRRNALGTQIFHSHVQQLSGDT